MPAITRSVLAEARLDHGTAELAGDEPESYGLRVHHS